MDANGNTAILEFEDWDGERYTIALYKETYVQLGGLAISALDATDPEGDDYLSPWGNITVNLPDNPSAASWCAMAGNVIIDTNNNSKELVKALVDAGIITFTGEACRSGYCTYPFAKVTPWAMDTMGTYEETIEKLSPTQESAPEAEPIDVVAVGAGYTFTLVSATETNEIALKESGITVRVNGQDYSLMKGATFEDSRKVDALLDIHGERSVRDHLRVQESSALRNEAEHARRASEQLAGNTTYISPERDNSR